MGEAVNSPIVQLKSALSKCDEYHKMLRGDLYFSFGPEMLAARRRCAIACKKFNAAEDEPRRVQVQLFRKCVASA